MKNDRTTGAVDILLKEEIEDSPVGEPGMRVEHQDEEETEEKIPDEEETQEKSNRYPTRERNQPNRFVAGSV